MRTITPDLVAAYWLCKRKAFLLLQRETGDTHEYARLVNARAASCLESYLRSFAEEGLRVHEGPHRAVPGEAEVIAKVTIRRDHLEATADALVCTFQIDRRSGRGTGRTLFWALPRSPQRTGYGSLSSDTSSPKRIISAL